MNLYKNIENEFIDRQLEKAEQDPKVNELAEQETGQRDSELLNTRK
jgi:hypothetical protein